MNSELEEKTARLQQLLGNEQLGGVLLNAQHNFAWLTGGRSNGIDMTRENGACYLFVTQKGKRYLIANNIEMNRLLAEEVSAHDFEPVEVTWQKQGATIVETARSLTEAGDLAADLPLFTGVRSVEPLIASCRYELTQPEMTRYRELGRDAGLALGNVTSKLAPDTTEREIARIVRDELFSFGIFPVVTLVAADDRIAKFRHPVPTNNTWKTRLLIVVCARRHGLIASLSRMICVGDIPSDLLRRMDATAAVNAALCAATTAGSSGAELYNTAAEAYAGQGFADEIDKHHQGGACGYRTRDWVAHPDSKDVVRSNQAFAWNPSMTGTKTEETVILIDGELEVITRTPDFPTISTFVAGREYFSPGVLSLSKGASA